MRTAGWHKFGIGLSSASLATYFIDENEVGFESGASVSVEGYRGGPRVFNVDDIRIRKAAATDPSISTVGPEEAGPWTFAADLSKASKTRTKGSLSGPFCLFMPSS